LPLVAKRTMMGNEWRIFSCPSERFVRRGFDFILNLKPET